MNSQRVGILPRKGEKLASIQSGPRFPQIRSKPTAQNTCSDGSIIRVTRCLPTGRLLHVRETSGPRGAPHYIVSHRSRTLHTPNFNSSESVMDEDAIVCAVKHAGRQSKFAGSDGKTAQLDATEKRRVDDQGVPITLSLSG